MARPPPRAICRPITILCSDVSSQAESFHQACARIFHEWDAAARSGDMAAMAALYTENCLFETALIPVILPNKRDGVLRGREELLAFLTRAAANRPNKVLKWHRSGSWLSDGVRQLAWEYPRRTPDGEQSDVAEFMEIEDGKIAAHRVYWGWKSTMMIAPALAAAAGPHAARWTVE
jgi:steroid Delta-isomerase